MDETQADTVPICRLKVDVKCCTMCRLKAKEKLQKLKGVKSVIYDSEGLVTITGNVNPTIILKTLEKWGKKAEILPDKKLSNKDVEDIDKVCSCHRDSHSDQNDKEPSFISQQSDLSINKQSKTKKGFLSLLFKKFTGGKKKLVETKGGPPKKWVPPLTPMAEYGGPMQFHRPFQPYPPPFMGMSSAPPYHPNGLIRPTLPPYDAFSSRTPLKVNPMIHYTNYVDNYSNLFD